MKDGGPAFPGRAEIFEHLSNRSAPIYRVEGTSGMSMRDWFAGMALQGLIAGSQGLHISLEEFAEQSFKLADAMLAVRGAND